MREWALIVLGWVVLLTLVGIAMALHEGKDTPTECARQIAVGLACDTVE